MPTALLSVYDKTGIVDFASGLSDLGWDLLSTGGTAEALTEAGLDVRLVEDLTGMPELFGGRVKTLHPQVHGGILARRDRDDDLAQMDEHGIDAIDLVAVNLYPFERTIQQPEVTLDEALHNIDIGGPTLIRSAAKNYAHVVVVTDPARYDAVLAALRESSLDGEGGLREQLAVEAFEHTSRYDALIGNWLMRNLTDERFPDTLNLTWTKVQDLRYGENAHQEAAFYRGLPTTEPSVPNAEQLHGKELSYNNILDVDAALEVVKDFEAPTCCIIKHNTPCGIASADRPLKAWQDAFATDTDSPFGGIVGFNRPVDRETAKALTELFLEVVVAPGFAEDALDVLTGKKNLRLLKVRGWDSSEKFGGLQFRSVVGGLLAQDRDIKEPDVDRWKVVTERAPTDAEMASLLFAFKAVRHVKSNSVVFAKGTRTVAIGGGQTSRVDASAIATRKGADDVDGSVMASDAFFPFRDAVDVAADHGVVAVVQPGGSIRDEEVIEAADEHGIAMVFSGQRAFRH